jgi:PAS domain S-box-containing protein
MPKEIRDPSIFTPAVTSAGESPLKTTHKILASLAGAVLLVALGVAVSFWSFRQIDETSEARRHTFIILDSADELLSALKDAETSQRGYLLTGDEAFLEPYFTVRNDISGHLEELRRITLNSAAHKHLDAMAPLIDAKLAELSHTIELRRNHEMTAALEVVRNGQGKQLMDSIRAEMSSFNQIEQDALVQHEAEFQSNMRLLFTLIVIASLFTLLFALAFTYLIYRGTQQRLKDAAHLETLHLLKIKEESNQQLQQVNMSLQVSEEKLAVTLNSIGDAVIATDAEGRVTLLNPLAEQLTGWKQVEALNRQVDEIFNIINKETRLAATIPVKSTLALGTIHGLANHTVLIARDGGECDIADSCAPIRGRDNQVVGAVLVFRDVTGEYAAQKVLHDQQFYTRSLIESSIDALITTDSSGIITDVNQQMGVLTGCTREELIGVPFKNYFTDPERAEAGIKRVLNEKKVTDYELTARAMDGKETVVSYNATNFYDRDGKLQGVFAAARDVTERNRLNQVLQEKNSELESAKSVAEKANLAKSEFLSSMSHELRSPLNAILGFAQLMESDIPPATPSQMESITQILQAGWHLLTLINEVLDLAKVESGHAQLSQEPVSLAEVILECQKMIAPQAQQHRIRMIFPLPDKAYYIRADRTRVKQVLINLLTNAIKYNIKQGTVEVTCAESTPGCIRVSIRDTGAGLSPQHLAQLFQAFNRLGQEAGGVEGTGIGLVVAKRLVELMGGAIGVESTLGVGSVFWFELLTVAEPLLSVEDIDAVALIQPHVARKSGLHTLLYVEDNPANLKLVKQIIARHPDMSLLTAVDGYGGIEIARASQPDVILMDINMPGMNGYEALKVLQSDPATAHIPVLALTANAMPRDIKNGLEAGFFQYITKPIMVNEFMEALNVALEFVEHKVGHTPKFVVVQKP